MQVRIFCSNIIEKIITDEMEFIAYHLKSNDRLVIYNFDESLIKELNEFESKVNLFKFEKNDECEEFFNSIHPSQTAESIKDRFLLFLLKSLNGYKIEFEPEYDPNIIEIIIS